MNNISEENGTMVAAVNETVSNDKYATTKFIDILIQLIRILLSYKIINS